MPRIPLQRPARRRYLARRRRRQHAGPQPHGAPDRAGQRQGSCRPLGRFRVGRTWRPARPDRPHLPAPHLPRRAGRGAPLPEPAGARIPRLRASTIAGSKRIARGCSPAVRLGHADPRHACGHIPAQAGHHGRARSDGAAFPSLLLLPSAGGCAARDVAGPPRRRHRSRRRHHRRDADLARTRRLRQGAAHNAAALPRSATWVWCAVRKGSGCLGGRRGAGDDAVAPRRSAGTAHRRVAVGDAPGGVRPTVRAAAALHRPRQRPRRTPRGGDVGRACPRGRHRGPRAHAALGRLQHRPHHARPRSSRSVPACAAYAGGRGAFPDRGPASGPRPRQRAPVSGPSSPSAAPGLQGGDGAGSG